MESPIDYLISLPIAGALAWVVFVYNGDRLAALIHWLEAAFPI